MELPLINGDFLLKNADNLWRYICVGENDGTVNLHEIGADPENWSLTRLAEPAKSGASAPLAKVAFSPDGSTLAAAWLSGEVVVYDTESTGRVASFFQNDCDGAFRMMTLSFSRDNARLAMGGGTCTTVSVRQIEPLQLKPFDISDSLDDLTGASVSADHVALICGSHVVIQSHSGEVIADICPLQPDGSSLPVSSSGEISPVQLRPGGKHVAMVLDNRTSGAYTSIVEVHSFEGAPRIATQRVFQLLQKRA